MSGSSPRATKRTSRAAAANRRPWRQPACVRLRLPPLRCCRSSRCRGRRRGRCRPSVAARATSGQLARLAADAGVPCRVWHINLVWSGQADVLRPGTRAELQRLARARWINGLLAPPPPLGSSEKAQRPKQGVPAGERAERGRRRECRVQRDGSRGCAGKGLGCAHLSHAARWWDGARCGVHRP